MAEDFSSILSSGLNTWKSNIKICIPFILSFASIMLFSIIYFLALAIVGGIILGVAISPLTSTGSPEAFQQMIALLTGGMIIGLLIIIIAVILYIVLVILLNSFFMAGAVGMCKEAIEKGSTSISTMLEYGKRKTLSLFLANIITTAIIFLGFILIGGLFIGIGLLLGISLPQGGTPSMMLLLVILVGVCVLILYGIIVDIIFSPVEYAVVLSDLGGLEGVKKGVSFTLQNKLYVFLLWFITAVISLTIEVIRFLINLGISVLPELLGLVITLCVVGIYLLLLFIIITPVYTVWWSKLYLSRIK